ncbi:MAG: hypothetical protein AAB439_01390 [Patescibacteria group bacterium]
MGGYLFLVGFIGFGFYLAVRFFEVRRGRRFFEVQRKKLDEFSVRLYRLCVFGELPTSYRLWFFKSLRHATHQGVVMLVALLRALERPLSRLNHRLRTPRVKTVEPRDPSPFLKTMADAQKKNGETQENSL